MSEGKSDWILVVDDEPDARAFLTTVLEDAGFAARGAGDGEEALAQIKAERPRLITLDVSMPGKSGVAVYRAVKESEEWRSIPVIITTGVSEDFRKFISSRKAVPPPEGYISKPVEHEKFLALVRELLAKSD